MGLVFLPFPTAASVISGDYKNRAEVDAFVNQLAVSSDYSQAELVELFSQVKNQRHLFERMDRPAEKLSWFKYRRIFLTEKRISKGVKFWRENLELIQQVSDKYQVPAEIIVAILGVETFYGAYKGKSPVFDTLVTFAFDYPKRAKFFLRELEQYLLLCKEQGLAPRQLKGSYAGAMGMPQFISSSYRAYAVDFDGDQQVNLFESMADVLASIANYFNKHGWRAGEPITRKLSVIELNQVDKLKPGVKLNYRGAELNAHGLVAKPALPALDKLAFISLEQIDHNEYWAGWNNFYVITRYNHSELYAMAAFQLSQQIKQRMDAN